MKKISFKASLLSIAIASSLNVQAAQVFVTDVVIQGSECVGFDCVNGENFGADTIRLKENNLRIHFNDTSNSGSFPSNDWRIVANDTTNGGSNYLAFEDSSAGTIPFRVMAGAGNNALYVDAQGDVGLNTSNPVVELHIADGDTPTMRLEQNGSSGWTAQTWDVAGNETNFFVRDVTNGSKLPFRVEPNTPDNALYLDSTGHVGMGTNNPKSDLHIVDSGSPFATTLDSQLIIQNTGNVSNVTRMSLISGSSGNTQIAFGDTDSELEGRIRYTHSDSTLDLFTSRAKIGLTLHDSGNELLSNSSNTAVLTSAGVWQDASSRELKQEIVNLSLEDALKTLKALAPVTYKYIADPTQDLNVGFIAEDVPDMVATSSRKTLASLDFIAVLTKVAQGQSDTIAELERKVSALEKQLNTKVK